MSQPNNISSLDPEGRINLAIQSFNQGQFQSIRAAAQAYSIHYSTLARRMNGTHSRRDCTPNSRKLNPLEESVLVQRILNLDSRGFPPRLSAVEDMANKLLADRAGGRVGVKWASNFVKRTPELKTRLNRTYDYQRAKCEDPELLTQWFKLVQNTITKYGIVNADMYNFDEAGFLIGMIVAGVVVTASERRARPKSAQPGNREWVTVIQV